MKSLHLTARRCRDTRNSLTCCLKEAKMLSRAAAASLIAGALLLSAVALAQTPEPKKVQEPEKLNVMYAVDSIGTLVPLERTAAKVRTSAKLTGGAKQVAQLEGAASALRLVAGVEPVFVVKLATGVDPGTWTLYAFESKKNHREVVLANAGYLSAKAGLGAVACDVSKYGEGSYKLTPAQPLSAGEYGFSSANSNDVFAFGVGPAK